MEDTPSGMSTGEFVAKLDAVNSTAVNASSLLSDELTAFLEGDEQVLLLLGEPGTGKSLFTWATVQELVKQARVLVAQARVKLVAPSTGDGAASSSLPTAASTFVPVVIDLRHHKVSKLKGLLPGHLASSFGLTVEDVEGLRSGASRYQPGQSPDAFAADL